MSEFMLIPIPRQHKMPAHPRKVANLDIVQPEGWKFVSTGDSACILTPIGESAADFLACEIWEHAEIKRIPFPLLFEDFVEKEIRKQPILSAGDTEFGRYEVFETRSRTAVVMEDGSRIHYLFTGIRRGREMYLARIRFSSLAVFARYRGDLEQILPPAFLPGLNVQDPSVLPTRRLRDVEVTIPMGWEYKLEADGMASITNYELAKANDPNEFLGIVVTAESEKWSERFENPETFFRNQTDRMLNPSKILNESDSGYLPEETPRGVSTLTRRVRYRYTSNRTIHWDHVGIWKEASAAFLSIRYSDPVIYQKLREDIDCIIESVEFWNDQT